MSTGASHLEPPAAQPRGAAFQVVLTGNPNCGKTTLFNALTGLRAKVGNYSGVTVERKEGRLLRAPKELPVTILDLPGTYSLSPQSLDEQVARDVLFHRLTDVPPPDLVVVVADASNLQRNLYFVTQVIELGYPTVLALNMVDVAQENGHEIDAAHLGQSLGVPVVPLVASRGEGVEELRRRLLGAAQAKPESVTPKQFYALPAAFEDETHVLTAMLEKTFPESHFQATAEAMLVLSDERFLSSSTGHYPDAIRAAVASARQRLEQAGVDWRSVVIESRYSQLAEIQQSATTETQAPQVEERIHHRLPGAVIGDLAAAIGGDDRNCAGRDDVLAPAGKPEREDRRMLNQPELVSGDGRAREVEGLHRAPGGLVGDKPERADQAGKARAARSFAL